MKFKVEKSDLKELREEIDKRYSTRFELEVLENKLSNYTMLSLTREVQKGIRDFEDHVQKTYLSEVNVNQRISNLRDEVYDKFSMKDGVHSNFQNLEKKIPQLAADIAGLRNLISKQAAEFPAVHDGITTLRKDLGGKCDINEINKVYGALKGYSTHEQYKDLYNKVVPALKTIEELTSANQAEVDKLNSIVNRFDEVLNEK
jgi:chromosome segregation ATPase